MQYSRTSHHVALFHGVVSYMTHLWYGTMQHKTCIRYTRQGPSLLVERLEDRVFRLRGAQALRLGEVHEAVGLQRVFCLYVTCC